MRLKAAGLALPFCHAKKAEEHDGDKVEHITEIRTIVVSPPDRSESDRALLNETFESSSLPYRVDEDGATVRREAPPGDLPEPKPAERDPVADARGRLNKMRGIH